MTGRRRLAVVVVAALLARLVLLVLRGDYIVYDEGYYLLLARSLRAGHGFALNGLPHVALSPLQPVLVAAISLVGLPDLWVSRLLGAVCGALLPLPVAAIARRAGVSPGGTLLAAALTAAAPALMSFVPFFPGRTWNLYFGSEPLFLLLVFAATAGAMRAAEGARWPVWAAVGACCAGAFLARGEGLIVAPLIMAMLLALTLARRRAELRRWAVAALVALALATPYLGYLRAMLGRWALSGRVQSRGAPAAPAAPTPREQGGSALDAFIWGGDAEALFRAHYRLTPDGSRMQSEYWGIRRDAAPLVAPAVRPETAAARSAMPSPSSAPGAPPSLVRRFARGLSVVMPWWFVALGAVGWVVGRRALRRAWWLGAAVLSALLPAIVAYVEPRSLLPLVPVAAIGLALLWDAAAIRLDGARGSAALRAGAIVLVVLCVVPVVRDGWEARGRSAPLQQLAGAQRAVGALLGSRLPADALVMSWHPALAIWSGRNWRVLPDEPLGRVVPYARAIGVSAIVFSRFQPSPLADPPRPFTVLLVDDTTRVPSSGNVRLAAVEDTPLMLVARLAPAEP